MNTKTIFKRLFTTLTLVTLIASKSFASPPPLPESFGQEFKKSNAERQGNIGFFSRLKGIFHKKELSEEELIDEATAPPPLPSSIGFKTHDQNSLDKDIDKTKTSNINPNINTNTNPKAASTSQDSSAKSKNADFKLDADFKTYEGSLVKVNPDGIKIKLKNIEVADGIERNVNADSKPIASSEPVVTRPAHSMYLNPFTKSGGNKDSINPTANIPKKDDAPNPTLIADKELKDPIKNIDKPNLSSNSQEVTINSEHNKLPTANLDNSSKVADNNLNVTRSNQSNNKQADKKNIQAAQRTPELKAASISNIDKKEINKKKPELDKKLNNEDLSKLESFIEKEIIMLSIKAGTLGNIDSEESLMDYNKYITFFWKNYSPSSAESTQSFIRDYSKFNDNKNITLLRLIKDGLLKAATRPLSLIDLKQIAFKSAAKGDIEGLRAVLDAFPLLEAKDSEGNNLLAVAIKNNQYRVTLLLLKKGISFKKIDRQGNSALAFARKIGASPKVCNLLTKV